MGYTMNKIDSYFNSIVESYESIHFNRVPCSSISYYGNTYRSVDLSNGSETVRISLVKNNQTISGFDYPVQTLTISSDKYVDKNKIMSENYKQFYFIGSNYFTNDLSEVKHARDTSLKRFLRNRSLSTYKTSHIDLKKISDRLLSYLKKAVDKRVSDCSYRIRDIYFRHCTPSKERQLVIVIKRSDKPYTEALCFNTQLLPMYISGQQV